MLLVVRLSRNFSSFSSFTIIDNVDDMAEASTLAKNITDKFLECPICIDTFQDPRALPCHHGFCKDCLVELVKSRRKKNTLVCPTCKRTVKLPKDGVQGLPVHFIINSLQDTVDMESKVTIHL